MRQILIVILIVLAFSGPAFATEIKMEKISDTEARRTVTVQDIVKLSDLKTQEQQIMAERKGIEQQYAQRKGYLDSALLSIQDQLKKADEAGIKGEKEK